LEQNRKRFYDLEQHFDIFYCYDTSRKSELGLDLRLETNDKIQHLATQLALNLIFLKNILKYFINSEASFTEWMIIICIFQIIKLNKK
ncbi:hypothetical protein BpHYR1_039660, partial [Brachionus plicatilis]